jgi:transcriptional regulator with XRE-family HTH domain
MKLQQKVGKRITNIRKEKKLTQLQFSYDVNIERSYITSIENGNKNISLSTLQKIIDALDVSAKEFFNDKMFGGGK